MGNPINKSALRAKRRLKKVLSADRENSGEDKNKTFKPQTLNKELDLELDDDIFKQSTDDNLDKLSRRKNTPKDPL